MNKSIKALMVIGQTCSGKEKLSLRLAELFKTEIISMDSMKIYREMNIGTAKASLEDQKRIKHHMIDIVNPNENYNVSQYINDALNAAKLIQDKNKLPLFSGGTPLYAKGLFSGLFEIPEIPLDIKSQIEYEYDNNKEKTYQKLTEIDPIAVQKIHLNDRQRVTRALEVYYATKSPISSLQNQFNTENNNFDFITIGILWPRPILHQRIAKRVKQMIELGLENEAKTLFAKYPNLGQGAIKAVGYQEFVPYFNNQMSLDETIEKIIINTRQLCKHQMTWMKKFNITWFEMHEQKSADELFGEVTSYLKEKNLI